jgi:hypothetical protein
MEAPSFSIIKKLKLQSVKAPSSTRERSLGNIANSHYVKNQKGYQQPPRSGAFNTTDLSEYSNRISSNSRRFAPVGSASSEFLENQRRNNIQFCNLFNVYKDTKRSIERGDLTSQRMAKLLKPR